jgi:hypothetical protein
MSVDAISGSTFLQFHQHILYRVCILFFLTYWDKLGVLTIVRLYYWFLCLVYSMEQTHCYRSKYIQDENKKMSLIWPKVKRSFIGSNNHLKKEPLKLAVSEIRPGPQSNKLTIEGPLMSVRHFRF